MENFIVKFSEEHVRIFEHENVFIVTESDVNAVANYYDTDIIDAFTRICESHNLEEDQLLIIREGYEEQSLAALETKKERLEQQLKIVSTEGASYNKGRIGIYKAEIEKINKAIKEKKAS